MTTQTHTPLISIIMGIYNCAGTLPDAVKSILAQTYQNWELIMCDDGSTDNTYEVAQMFVGDKEAAGRIILIKNELNRGLQVTLNRCLEAAKGEFIARMDGDDVCEPTRLEKELNVFMQEEEIDIVSTDMAFFDETGDWGLIQHPTYPVARDFIKESPFCHAPCLVRRRAYDAVGGYSEDDRVTRVEDYDLWVRMYAKGFRGKNLHEILYKMRDDRNAFKRRKYKYRINEARVKVEAVRWLHLPGHYVLQAAKPLVVGALPEGIYKALHRRRLSSHK